MSRVVARQGSGSAAPTAIAPAIWIAATVLTVLGVLVLCVLLRQPGGPHPWARLDLYAGGFLLVAGVAGVWQSAVFFRMAVRSIGGVGEALGLDYDPGSLVFAALLEPGKFAVVLDYAHWHLVPALEQPALRALGLAVAVAGSAGVVWTDRRLARHFASAEDEARVITDGPYRVVRHPRYASLLLLCLAMPLVFASILGWLLLVLVVAVVVRRIGLEEPHLHALFGEAWDAYASRTARLLPGVY